MTLRITDAFGSYETYFPADEITLADMQTWADLPGISSIEIVQVEYD